VHAREGSDLFVFFGDLAFDGIQDGRGRVRMELKGNQAVAQRAINTAHCFYFLSHTVAVEVQAANLRPQHFTLNAFPNYTNRCTANSFSLSMRQMGKETGVVITDGSTEWQPLSSALQAAPHLLEWAIGSAARGNRVGM
jgi:hypothetical protein